MWFKNLRAYRLTYDTGLTADALDEALTENEFVPCGKIDKERAGWVPPIAAGGTMLTHTVGDCTMICLRKQEKVLPPAAINEQLEVKISELESREGRRAARRERLSLKDEVMMDLLPRALTRSERIYAYFDFRRQYLLIDAASAGKAELVIDYLRAVLKVLPVVPLDSHADAADVMTRWIKGRMPDGFALNLDVELQNTRESRNVVRCRHQEIDSKEVLSHIDAGKRVTALAMNWREAIHFMLHADFAIKRLRFDDHIVDHGDASSDDAAEAFDQDFAVMIVQLGRLLDELIEACGGPEKI
ncbi:MAG: recombination-associated protein RdgC [Pseudomonadota bacterium]